VSRTTVCVEYRCDARPFAGSRLRRDQGGAGIVDSVVGSVEALSPKCPTRSTLTEIGKLVVVSYRAIDRLGQS
jgi:hypothetical protein